MKKQKFELSIGEKRIEVTINNLAEQANGSVFVRYGDTMVLATCVMSKKDREEGADFFPLSVDYEERFYAAGKIYGSRYIRREGRPSNEAIITARLIDRTIRPLFPEYLRKEVQVIVTCLSWDGENDADIPAILAVSLALLISDIPWNGPIAPLRIGRKNGKFVLNPTYQEREEGDLDIVFSAVKNDSLSSDPLINMLETKAKEVDEGSILKAVDFSNNSFQKLFSLQEQIQIKVGKKKIQVDEPKDKEIEADVKNFIGKRLEETIMEESDKMEKTMELKQELLDHIEQKYDGLSEKIEYAARFFEKETKSLVHENIIKKNKRPDGRKMGEIRRIACETNLLPRAHGSGLFCRGKTKSLSVLTLGAPGDRQIIEGMEIVGEKRFMHHYNFPPYSVGEVRPLRGPGRRDIGHGLLAERAIEPLLPDIEKFPYTIRIVSEILSSNGSTSMASATSSSLALMDAGVPIESPVTGIAIGLMQNKRDEYKILADIQGPEDHYGDMDLKVAGTKKGITVMQMDVKIRGISKKIFKEALEMARKCKFQILEEIKKEIKEPRPHLSSFAPKIYTLEINPEKIGELIGPKGKTINEIIRETGTTIDIQDSGLVFVTSEDETQAQRAIDWIKDITKEIKIGESFQGKVKKTLDFGAFVQLTPKQEGLIHISKLAPYRVERVEDVVKTGDTVSVKVISIDEQGRINLSLQKKPRGK